MRWKVGAVGIGVADLLGAVGGFGDGVGKTDGIDVDCAGGGAGPEESVWAVAIGIGGADLLVSGDAEGEGGGDASGIEVDITLEFAKRKKIEIYWRRIRRERVGEIGEGRFCGGWEQLRHPN